MIQFSGGSSSAARNRAAVTAAVRTICRRITSPPTGAHGGLTPPGCGAALSTISSRNARAARTCRRSAAGLCRCERRAVRHGNGDVHCRTGRCFTVVPVRLSLGIWLGLAALLRNRKQRAERGRRSGHTQRRRAAGGRSTMRRAVARLAAVLLAVARSFSHVPYSAHEPTACAPAADRGRVRMRNRRPSSRIAVTVRCRVV